MANRKENSTYSRNEKSIIECDLTYVVSKIDGRWKLQLFSKLEERKFRFSELKKEFSLSPSACLHCNCALWNRMAW